MLYRWKLKKQETADGLIVGRQIYHMAGLLRLNNTPVPAAQTSEWLVACQNPTQFSANMKLQKFFLAPILWVKFV
jgi:hypothetical protein